MVSVITSLLVVLLSVLLAYWFSLSTTRLGYIILVGNPGAGKSTILNGILGKPVFGAVISLGEGYTKESRLVRSANATATSLYYGDTPGLDDAVNRVKAAQEITKGLRSGKGDYKLVFVVNQEGGRVRTSDSVTMKVVLDALPDRNAPYGIVVNKVTKPVQKMLEANDGVGLATFLACLNQGRDNITPFVHLYPYVESLHDQNNAVHQIRPEFVQFLELLPSFDLRPSEVKDVSSDDYQRLSTQIQKEMEELRSDKRKIEEENVKMREKLKKYPSFATGVAVGAGGVLIGSGAGVLATQFGFEMASKLGAQHASQLLAQTAMDQSFRLAATAENHAFYIGMVEAAGKFLGTVVAKLFVGMV